MPIHDWTRVKAGIFHAFHHSWIEEIARALNRGVLPPDFYALAEQYSGRFGPDVLTLQGFTDKEDDDDTPFPAGASGSPLLAAPKMRAVGRTEMEAYRRKQNSIAVRHVTGDGIVALIEIVSPGNKAGRKPMRAFLEKAAELIDKGIHLLILDVQPPGKRDPEGIHGEIWQEIAGEDYELPADKPFTFASYESDTAVQAYVLHAGLGDLLPDMPLFLLPQQAVSVPLNATYDDAYGAMPARWRAVIERAPK